MILGSLRALALREGLSDDPAFESKPVRWIIELDDRGCFRQLYDTNALQSQPDESKTKSKLEAKLMAIPRRRIRSSGIRADFLVDNAKYVLAIDSNPEAPDPKNAERHSAYLLLLQKAAEESDQSAVLSAVLSFLQSDAQRKACQLELAWQGGFADNDLFGFEVDGTFLHEVQSLRSYWISRSQNSEAHGRQVQCLICGEQRILATLHNQIQIRGASTSGIPLVSFNSNAFEKYGWEGSANAPICTECMTAYVESLRRLTRPRYDNPRTRRRMSPLSTGLTNDTTAIYWAGKDSSILDGLSLLRDDPKRVRDLLDNPRQGIAESVGDPTRFYCLILSGVQGRAIVRRMQIGTVGEVESNLRRYFGAIDVDRFDRSAPLPQFRLLKSLVLNGELDRLSPELGTDLWLVALFGTPLSRSFLAAVTARNRAERKVTLERAALLHLYFSSHHRSVNGPGAARPGSQSAKENSTEMSLNHESKDQAYLLGRLLAVLESVQTTAQGQNLNRNTLVDRSYGAASTRPGLVFPQLIQTAQHHFAKAGKWAAGRAFYLDKLLGEIMDGLEMNGFAATLNLEQQGRFALGYYHQRQNFYSKPESDGPTLTPGKSVTTEEEIAA